VSELGVVLLLLVLCHGGFSYYVIMYMLNIMYNWLLKREKPGPWKKKREKNNSNSDPWRNQYNKDRIPEQSSTPLIPTCAKAESPYPCMKGVYQRVKMPSQLVKSGSNVYISPSAPLMQKNRCGHLN